MNPIPLNLVFEDQLSEFVMRKLLEKFDKFYISHSYSEGGFGYIKKNITGFNEAAKGCSFFVLADLDAIECAPTLLNQWLNKPRHPNLIFRVAVREIEAWVLADIDGFSRYTGVSKANFNDNPEEITDPKKELLRIVRRSRKRIIRDDILPKDEFALVGPGYNERLGEFIIKHWNIGRAIKRSDSLRRTVHHLDNFKMIYT